jgi:hypothetical protein
MDDYERPGRVYLQDSEVEIATDPRYTVSVGKKHGATAYYHGERSPAPGYGRATVDLAEMVTDAPGPHNPHSAAVEAMVAILVDTFHEALEFTTVDGKPVAAAHCGEYPEFMYMEEGFRSLVEGYIERFPVDKA